MPNRTLVLTDPEDAELARLAAASGTTVDDLLLAEARNQIAQIRTRRLADWWRDLPQADQERIYAAETGP